MIFLTERIMPLLVLIIQVFNVSAQSRMTPTINVNDSSERIINEGETIELECTGDEGLVFHYPKNNLQTSVTHNNASLIYTKNDTKSHIKFSLNSTTSQDTGYYGCTYNGLEFKENIYNSLEAAWIYIYVKSNHSLFVQTENADIISGYIQHKAVIPCRPTSPNYTVTLSYLDTKNAVYQEVERNHKVIFDLKFGFELKNLDKMNKGYYRCKFTDEGKRFFQTCYFELQVYHPPVLTIQTSPEFAIEGQDYHLECKIDDALSSYPDPKLGWIGPNGDIYQDSSIENRITANSTIAVAKSPQIDGTSTLAIKNVTFSDAGNYTCVFLLTPNDLFVKHHYITVYVDHPSKLEIETTPQLVIKGQVIQLECRMYGLKSHPTSHQVQWIAPNEDVYQHSTSDKNRITSNVVQSETEADIVDVTNILTIKNSTLSDAGNYTCRFLSNGRSNIIIDKHQYIKVYDPEDYPIIVTRLIPSERIAACFGSSVTLNATINSTLTMNNSKIEVEWLDREKERIHTDLKYGVTTTDNFTQLVIRDAQTNDTGYYYLQVSNIIYTTKLRFDLTVWLPPVVHFDQKLKSHYKRLTEIKLECHSTKPESELNMTWYFQKHYGNNSYGRPESLENAVVDQNRTSINSTISLKPTKSGRIICQVCHAFKCSTEAKNVTIIEDDALEIQTSPEEITEGNEVNVTCTGSMLYYTDIRWYNQGHKEIKENERIKFSVVNSSDYLGSIMTINFIKITDEEQPYKCGATTGNGSTIFKKIELSVKAKDHPLQPIVIRSNMNGSVVYYDLETARQIVINLTCEVDKLQEQNISWFKDDQYIDGKNDTYQFSKRKQLLSITHPDKTCSGLYRCSVDGSDKALLKIVITDGSLKWPTITGIAVGAVACVALVIVGVILYWKKKNQKKSQPEDPLTDGNYALINYGFVLNDPVQFERLISNWEIPRDKLDLGKRLGYGQFGQVLRGTVLGITAPNTETEVAVKIARRMPGGMSTLAQNTEFRILCHLGKHLNIVSLLGVVRNVDRGLLLVVEYCRYGNFQEYLIKCRKNFFSPLDIKTSSDNLSMCAWLKNKLLGIQGRNARRDYVHSYFSRYANSDQAMALPDIEEAAGTVIVDPDCPPNLHRDYEGEIILVEDLLIWAYQAALAMDYVSRKKVIHGDLAARNILLADNNTVQICDFGLSRKLYQADYHRKKSQTPMPVKWMAIESIEEKLFTTKSDVWSYGVVLWEIFTLARSPYPEFENPQEISQQLLRGYRMPKPKYMPEEIYTVTRQCWESNPKSRPTFSQLVKTIGNMLPKHVAKHFITLNGSSAPSAGS